MSDRYPVTIYLFAMLKEQAGRNRLEMEIPAGTDVTGLRRQLATHVPGIAPLLPSALVSINQEFAFDEDPVPAGAEIAFFPPVSGGSSQGAEYQRVGSETAPEIYMITADPMDMDRLVEKITLHTTGAACIFSGMVRGETTRKDAHITEYLEYEAYQPMAEAKMKQVAQEIRSRWPSVQGIAIVQRIGRLYPGTPTVLIACTAAHRDTGVFEAARYGIDRLKEIVPVWKKEIGKTGEQWITGSYTPVPDDRMDTGA